MKRFILAAIFFIVFFILTSFGQMSLGPLEQLEGKWVGWVSIGLPFGVCMIGYFLVQSIVAVGGVGVAERHLLRVVVSVCLVLFVPVCMNTVNNALVDSVEVDENEIDYLAVERLGESLGFRLVLRLGGNETKVHFSRGEGRREKLITALEEVSKR